MEGRKTGTTTVGIVCGDGTVFAADKRATMGYFIANRDVPKIFQVDDTLGVTVAGSVGDAQALVRLIKAEIELYKMTKGASMTINAAATLLANVLFGSKYFPFYVQMLIGGYDTQARVYSLDPVGGTMEERFVSTGSGSPTAYGVLEEGYKEGMKAKEGVRLAARAVSTALKRDCGSGDGVEVVVINKDGYKRLADAEVKEILQGS
jgi:proteasome beta subunit